MKRFFRKYAAIVFISFVRFETSKRKLQYLTFSDFLHCATAIMTNWTYRDATPEFDLDREFLLDLRDVRMLLEKEREHKQYSFIMLLLVWNFSFFFQFGLSTIKAYAFGKNLSRAGK